MALLDELVQEEDLDPEVMGQTSSAFKNLPELEKIRRLIQMDLLEEPHLLRNMSDRYNLPLLSKTLDEVQNYDKIVLSTPAYASAKIVKNRYPKLAKDLEKVEYTPIAIIGFSGDIKPKSFGILTTKLRTLGILMDKYIFPNRNGIRVMVGGKRFEDIKNMSEKEILNFVLDDIKTIIGENNLKFEFFKLWEKGIPNYGVGHLQIIKI